MPELPDIVVYVERLEALVRDEPLHAVAMRSPFVLRTVSPPITNLVDHRVTSLTRLGKRIALGFDHDLYVVIHLMIAGRLRWRLPGKRLGGRQTLAEFSFPHGTLFLTEAGTKRRASIHVVEGINNLAAFGRGGLEVLESDLAGFEARLLRENHTLKRSLTDPRLFSGIGNAYSDEILHRARLSPLQLTSRMSAEERHRLFEATQVVLQEWTALLRAEATDGLPEHVTAFREGMAVHGRYGQPCPVCGSKVQRIRYAENETNYCARCQTGGKLLADRSLSRLLKDDWPRSLDELES